MVLESSKSKTQSSPNSLVPEDFVLEYRAAVAAAFASESVKREAHGTPFSKKEKMEFCERFITQKVAGEPDLNKVFAGLSTELQHRCLVLLCLEQADSRKKKKKE